jgi:hypothetical protein
MVGTDLAFIAKIELLLGGYINKAPNLLLF